MRGDSWGNLGNGWKHSKTVARVGGGLESTGADKGLEESYEGSLEENVSFEASY